MKSNYYHCS